MRFDCGFQIAVRGIFRIFANYQQAVSRLEPGTIAEQIAGAFGELLF